MARIDPAVKFVSLLLVTLILAWRYDPVLNLSVAAVCVVLMFAAKVPPKKLLLLSLPILLAALGMFFTGYHFSADGGMPVRTEHFLSGNSALWNGLAQGSRVMAYGAVGYLFALTTDRIRLVRSFRRQFHIPQIFAYGLLAAWGMVPQMFLEYRRTRAAFRARGIRVFPVSPALLKPLLVKSVRWSEALSVAMESKGFSGDAQRTEFEPALIRPSDWLFLTASVGLVLLTAILLP